MRFTAVVTLVVVSMLMWVSVAPHHTAHALDNGLAVTPQMGWNSWNHFGCSLNEKLIEETADLLVSLGLANAGYVYLNLDDCWALERDNFSRVVPDPSAFPSGMFALGEYIHSKGLKFGIYSDAGNTTCAGRPGSLGHEAIDALTYAAWQVDYLKYDNCANDNIDPKVRYPVMRDALNFTGRPIFFSLCEWGVEDPATWAGPVGNSWRTTQDIYDAWESITWNLDHNADWYSYAGPGHWNDPDMLEIGNGGLTNDEEISHFSLWAVMKSPLIIGADLSTIPGESLAVLLNTEVIALNQDPLGVQAQRVYQVNTSEVWAGELSDGSYAVVLLNRDNVTVSITANWTLFGWAEGRVGYVRDLWQHKDLGTLSSYTATLATHASVTLKVTPVSEEVKVVEPVKEVVATTHEHATKHHKAGGSSIFYAW